MNLDNLRMLDLIDFPAVVREGFIDYLRDDEGNRVYFSYLCHDCKYEDDPSHDECRKCHYTENYDLKIPPIWLGQSIQHRQSIYMHTMKGIQLIKYFSLLYKGKYECELITWLDREWGGFYDLELPIVLICLASNNSIEISYLLERKLGKLFVVICVQINLNNRLPISFETYRFEVWA